MKDRQPPVNSVDTEDHELAKDYRIKINVTAYKRTAHLRVAALEEAITNACLQAGFAAYADVAELKEVE